MSDSLTLADPDLLRDRCLVGGAWVSAESGETISVTNPATGAVLGTVPRLQSHETTRAVENAQAAFEGWSQVPAKQRAAALRRWYDLLMAHHEDLARIMTLEQGKPLSEARDEVAYGASFIEWFSEEARRTYGDVIPSPRPDGRIVVMKQPVGVCAAITPWNFPIAMLARKVGPALAAGCTIVVKPASQTPFCALAMGWLALEAGIPAGVMNIVTGNAREIGNVLCGHPAIRKVSFTGSTEVGRALMRQSADTVKRISLELGGNAPFIVLDDADLDAAVQGAIASKFRNAGQTCVCANRLLVHESVHDDFVERLSRQASALKVGDGLAPGTQVGPLIDETALAKVEDHLSTAVAQGARVVTGGKRFGQRFFEPTILVDATPAMQVAREETFGPIAPIIRFKTDEQAVALANDTQYGLAAYLYGNRLNRMWRIAEKLEFGMVGMNTGLISTCEAPFGGMKQSGIGREGSRYGIDEYLETKYLAMSLA